MSFDQEITLYHLDVLKEVGNIGAGHAATALSTLLGKRIDMKVPLVKVVSFDDMMEMAGGPENIVVSVFVRIEGEISGSMFFILPLPQAETFIRTMTHDESFSFDTPPYSEIGLSAMQEMENILSSTYLSSLSDFTQLNLYPTVPALSVDMVGAIISYGLVELSQVSDQAIVVDTALFGEGHEGGGVTGQFFLLPDPDSFHVLFKSLGVE